MAKINISVTATQAQFSAFADELGYQPFNSIIDGNGDLVTVPNPQDRSAFLQTYFKNTLVNELTKVKIKAIDNDIRDTREAEKIALKNSISSAIAVTAQA